MYGYLMRRVEIGKKQAAELYHDQPADFLPKLGWTLAGDYWYRLCPIPAFWTDGAEIVPNTTMGGRPVYQFPDGKAPKVSDESPIDPADLADFETWLFDEAKYSIHKYVKAVNNGIYLDLNPGFKPSKDSKKAVAENNVKAFGELVRASLLPDGSGVKPDATITMKDIMDYSMAGIAGTKAQHDWVVAFYAKRNA